MTSVVDTSVKYFSSLMSGAPALSGTVGSMIALLDACLKDGFDLKTLASLTVAGGVATAAFTGTHSAAVDSVVLIAGVTGGPTGWAGLNGEQKITGKPGAASATFATNLPDGVYTGTITMKMAPLGFAKPFAGTNLAAYQSTDPASTKMILRLDDTVATTTRVVGCESMTDIGTYAGLFPTALQFSGGGYWAKSIGANSTPVQWMVIGDSRAFYIHVCPGFSSNASWTQGFTRGFGDAVALKPGGDAYACFLSYSDTAAPAGQITGQPEYAQNLLQAFPRAPTGLGSSLLNNCFPYVGTSAGMSGMDTFFGPFPSIIDGALRVSRRFFATGTGVPPRADAPGIYSVPHNLSFDSFKFNDRQPGTGVLAGRNLIVVNSTNTSVNQGATSSVAGTTFFDVTGPWR
jgi:hypothetical protein